MALTVTRDEMGVQGNKRIVYGKLTFDTSYATGGLSLKAADLGLGSLTRLIVDTVKGFDSAYDYVNQKLVANYGSQFAMLSAQNSGAGVGNGADTTDDTLFTFTVPINALKTNGQSIRLTAWGATAATVNNKRVRALLDASVLSTGTVTWNNLAWWLDAQWTRVDATHVNGIMSITAGANTVTAFSLNQVVANMGTATLALTVTGASQTTGAANDVAGHAFIAELLGVVGGGTGLEVPAGTDLSGLTLNYMAEGV